MESPFLTGKRIYLRPLNPEDLEGGYLNWLNNPEINKYLMAGIFPTTSGKLKEYYEKITHSGTDIILAIVLKKGKKHIGNIKIGGIDWVNRSAHCGRLIGNKKYWGKGYGTEAMKLIVDYAFGVLNLNRIYTTAVADNIRAIKSCKNSGMSKEGIFRQARFLNGEYKDIVQMAITRDNYKKRETFKR